MTSSVKGVSHRPKEILSFLTRYFGSGHVLFLVVDWKYPFDAVLLGVAIHVYDGSQKREGSYVILTNESAQATGVTEVLKMAVED